MQIAKIAVEAATYAIDKPYSYLVPSDMELSVGCRVLAPFGRGNRTSEGVVLSLEQEMISAPLKALRLNLDGEPVITRREIKLALWMRQRYFCTFYDAIRTILPAAVWYRYREQWQLTGKLTDMVLPPREAAIYQLLSDGPQELEAIQKSCGEQAPVLLRSLEKRAALEDRQAVLEDKQEDKN